MPRSWVNAKIPAAVLGCARSAASTLIRTPCATCSFLRSTASRRARLAVSTRCAPPAANSSARAAPIPELAPVTSAHFPHQGPFTMTVTYHLDSSRYKGWSRLPPRQRGQRGAVVIWRSDPISPQSLSTADLVQDRRRHMSIRPSPRKRPRRPGPTRSPLSAVVMGVVLLVAVTTTFVALVLRSHYTFSLQSPVRLHFRWPLVVAAKTDRKSTRLNSSHL